MNNQRLTIRNIESLHDKLHFWYLTHHRDLPWRRTHDPYRIWVSEVMLQQTQVRTVLPYYRKFLKQFPNLKSLTRADLSTVLKVWEGLGYYARARNLHKAAKTLQVHHQGVLPDRYDELKAIPGIGEYTAAAIASLAFGQAVPVLDGNVRRVLSRWLALQEDTTAGDGKKKLVRTAHRFLNRDDPGAWNQAVMELGATLCLPRKPKCAQCPVAKECRAFRKNLVDKIPKRKPHSPLPHYQVTAGLISDGKSRDQILIARRHERGLLGGLWEFPGGKQETGETLSQCLARELREELGIEVRVGRKFCSVEHAYSHFRITLHVYRCRWRSGQPQALDCAEWKWVSMKDLKKYAFPRADRYVIEKLTKS